MASFVSHAPQPAGANSWGSRWQSFPQTPESAQEQPAQQNPGYQQRIQGQPAQQDPGYQQRFQGQPAQQNPGCQQRSQGQPTQQNPGYQQRSQGQPARQNPGYQQRSQGQPARQNPGYQQHDHGESPVDDDEMNGIYPRYYGIKAHGTKAALYFTPDKTKNGYHTVAIEAAEMLIPAEKKYNWKQKTRLQLTRTEILDVIAVMLGLLPGCEFGNHKGSGTVKSFAIKNQGKSVFVSVMESGRPVKAVPVPIMEAVQIGHMMLTVYIQNYPGLTPDVVLPTLNRAVQGRLAAQQPPQQQGSSVHQ